MDGVESCDRKRCREGNPQHINNERKKRKKQKNKGEGAEVPHPSNPAPDSNPGSHPIPVQQHPIPIQQHPTTTEPRKKRKKRKNRKVQTKTETPPQSTEGLTLTKIPFKWPSQTSMGKSNAKSPRAPPRTHDAQTSLICRACRQRGHRFEVCQRLKYLSRDDEICFFCGEIGHSLGKCSPSTAGGGRFAKCLFCYAQGHFSINCPRNGYRINPKVAAASGPINKTVENELMPIAEATNV